MTPEKRLNQIEPLMAEHSAQLDLHTAQLRRISLSVQTIAEGVGQQTDNMVFLLNEVAQIKQIQEQQTQILNQQSETLQAILNILQQRSDN